MKMSAIDNVNSIQFKAVLMSFRRKMTIDMELLMMPNIHTVRAR